MVEFLDSNKNLCNIKELEKYQEIQDTLSISSSSQSQQIATPVDNLDDFDDDYLMTKVKKNVKAYLEIEDLKKKVNKKDKNGETELHHACKKDDLNYVKKLVEKCGYDINAVDNGGWTPLSEAVDYEQVEIIKYLVERGADLNTKSKEGLETDDMVTKGGRTPLMEACERGNADIISILLKGRADPCLLSDANWRASDYLEKFINDNPSHERINDLRIFLKALKQEEVRKHAQKVKLKKDVLENKKFDPVLVTKKPLKELDEDEKNLLEYEGALAKFGKIKRSRPFEGFGPVADHVNDENLDDPDFLEDDMNEDIGDSMEVMLPKKNLATSVTPKITHVNRVTQGNNVKDDVVVLKTIKTTPVHNGIKRHMLNEDGDNSVVPPPTKRYVMFVFMIFKLCLQS